MEDPKRIVQQGYDQLGSSYREHYEKSDSERYGSWLSEFMQQLPPSGNVLELGCADGIPTARYLSQYIDYLGVDISSVQIALARQNVPTAHFKVADMTELRFADESFSGIVALYSIIHIPLGEQPALFKALYAWLKPDGLLLCIVGADRWTGTDENWVAQGVLMYWSHSDTDTYERWFTELGFTVLTNTFIPEGNSGHTLFLVKKQAYPD